MIQPIVWTKVAIPVTIPQCISTFDSRSRPGLCKKCEETLEANQNIKDELCNYQIMLKA